MYKTYCGNIRGGLVYHHDVSPNREYPFVYVRFPLPFLKRFYVSFLLLSTVSCSLFS